MEGRVAAEAEAPGPRCSECCGRRMACAWAGGLTWASGLLVGVHNDWALVKEKQDHTLAVWGRSSSKGYI